MNDKQVVEVASTQMRLALRHAVEKVLGPNGSAVLGDDLADALRAAGFDVVPADGDLEFRHWWITTGVETQHGRKVVGPFDTKADAFTARTHLEKVEGHNNYWIERLVPVGGEG